MIHPYGPIIELYGFLGYRPGIQISEMARFQTIAFLDYIYLASIAISIACIVKTKNMPLRYILLFIGTTLMMFNAYRNTMFYMFFGIIPILYASRFFKRDNQDEEDQKNFAKALIIFSSVFLVFSGGVYVYLTECLSMQREFPLYMLPILLVAAIALILCCKTYWRKAKSLPFYRTCAVSLTIMLFGIYGALSATYNTPEKHIVHDCIEWLEQNESSKDVRIMTTYEVGGYLEYYGYKPYIDPRAEVFFKSINEKADIFDEFISIQIGSIPYYEILDKYNIDYVLALDSFDIFYKYLPSDNNYELVFHGEHGDLYKRR
jgi:hypothetical protein